jgi:hypothetical protein
MAGTTYNPMVPYLVNQMVIGKLTYQEVITSPTISAKPALATQIDNYIAEKNLTIDKTV